MVVLIAMFLGEVFERFIAESPLVVMLKVVLEQNLSAEEVDRVFLDNAQEQYEKELLFSTVVSLMSLVVCGIAKSVNSAYQSNAEQVGVKVQALYQKLNGIEAQVCEALVRHGVAKAKSLIEQLGMVHPSLVEGYRVKILDGNHLSASERRLAVLRSMASAPLPGQALMVLDPALQLAIDVFACEDGHVHGPDKIEVGISSYYLADEIRRVYDGMMIAIPPQQWQPLRGLEPSQTAELLKALAAQMVLAKYKSYPRGKKKKKPKPKRQKDKPHVSTARLLAQARDAKRRKAKTS